jgi:hypothetical protein
MRLIVFLLVAIFALPARAETLQEQVDKLEVLSLPYGPTQLKVNNEDVLIVRGRFENGNAWGGDIYTVLVRQGNVWQIARHEEAALSGVLTETRPHTDEDSIESIRFMVPKGAEKSGNLPALYLLDASRNYMTNTSGVVDPNVLETRVTFTLDIMQREKDFGIVYLHELIKTSTKKNYCNVDWALNKELRIAFPDNNPDGYECKNRP